MGWGVGSSIVVRESVDGTGGGGGRRKRKGRE